MSTSLLANTNMSRVILALTFETSIKTWCNGEEGVKEAGEEEGEGDADE